MQRISSAENIEKHSNLLDLYYDIDNYGFSIYILKPFLEKFLESYNSQIIELEFNEDDIRRRRKLVNLIDIHILEGNMLMKEYKIII